MNFVPSIIHIDGYKYQNTVFLINNINNGLKLKENNFDQFEPKKFIAKFKFIYF